jgi:hypothetical protein
MLPMQQTHITTTKPAKASIPPGEFDCVLSKTKLTSVSGSYASWSLFEEAEVDALPELEENV